jgi:alpha-ketoglutarate-dependent taurine dioxygenase
MIAFERTFIAGEQIPLVWRITQGNDSSIDVVTDWLREHNPVLIADRDRYGAVLLRGFNAIDSAERFSDALEAIAPHLMDYVGGSAPREVVFRRVTTASGLPGTYSLALHQEMAYQASRPDVLALFCDVPPDEGGETPIADARVVTSRLDAGVRDRFAKKGIGVRRALPSPAEGAANRVPRPWSHVFGTEDRDEVERIAQEKQWTVEWRPNGSMLLFQQVLPAFKTHPRTGEHVWANQVHYHMPGCMIQWAVRDGREDEAAQFRKRLAEEPETLDHAFHDDGSRVAGEDAEHVWDILAASEIPVRWQRTDVMLVDNVIAMHGRRRYRGNRRILVGMIKD